jgi:hypothetical protein
MLLLTTDSPDYVSMSCFSCKAALLKLASSWLGQCLSAKRSFDRAVLMPRLLPLPRLPSGKAAFLNLTHLLRAGALPSQHKGLSHGLAHVKVSSQSV